MSARIHAHATALSGTQAAVPAMVFTVAGLKVHELVLGRLSDNLGTTDRPASA